MEPVKVLIKNSTGSTTWKAVLFPSGVIKYADGTFSHIVSDRAANRTITEVVEVKQEPVTYDEETKTNIPVSEMKAKKEALPIRSKSPKKKS